MLKLLVLISLILLGSCATKYTVPTNRFFTPESQGGAFQGQAEFQYTQSHILTLNTDNSSVEDGVYYKTLSKPAYAVSTSMFDAFDFMWSHNASGLSLVGGKIQFLGGSRSASAAGNKLSAVVLLGANEHETDDGSVDFRLGGTEFHLIYGFRLTSTLLPYVSVGRSSYKFDASITSSDESLDGQTPLYETYINSFTGGLEASFESFFLKAEFVYQEIDTSHTKDKTYASYGLAFGMSW